MEVIEEGDRDEPLMKSIIEKYLDCGNTIYKYREAVNIDIRKFSYLRNKVIPFFKQYPIQGVKHLDFIDFCKVVELMISKAHLTTEGIDQIRKIKDGMNVGRESSE